MPRTILNCKYLSYRLRTNHSAFIRLPLLHIRLIHGEDGLTTIALVDSGSTTTFIPLEFAEILSLPVKKQETAVGAGGKFENTIRNVTIQILRGRGVVAEFPDFPVYVPTEQDRIPYVVLGRDSIFRKFDITFRENLRRFVMKTPKKK